MVKRMRLEKMEEQAKLVSAASKIVDQLTTEERARFMEQFNAPGWNAQTMNNAFMEARQTIHQREEFARRGRAGLPG